MFAFRFGDDGSLPYGGWLAGLIMFGIGTAIGGVIVLWLLA